MLHICFYFQVHQPYRLRKYSIFDVGQNINYFDDGKNAVIIKKVGDKCYLPTNHILLNLLKKHPEFKISFSFSGVVLDQFEQYYSEVLKSFQRLVATGQVEILSETYHHSLAFVFDEEEFFSQVILHKKKINDLFGVTPTILRNTELIYNNKLAVAAHKLGFKGVLLEGADKILGWRSPNFVYQAHETDLSILLKNYRLSDDIAFRFSEKTWSEYPLTADKFTRWVNAIHGNGTNLNLFMDYETFGEHQWESTGIFNFLRFLPGELLKHSDTRFSFPSDLVKIYEPVGRLDVPNFVSWADIERDLSAWHGNRIQDSALKKVYKLKKKIEKTGDKKIIDDWRKLQTSDHFYYMCTKWFNDGDVHKYFNPYDSPYEAFIYFINVLKDLELRCDQLLVQKVLRTKKIKIKKVADQQAVL